MIKWTGILINNYMVIWLTSILFLCTWAMEDHKTRQWPIGCCNSSHSLAITAIKHYPTSLTPPILSLTTHRTILSKTSKSSTTFNILWKQKLMDVNQRKRNKEYIKLKDVRKSRSGLPLTHYVKVTVQG